MTSNRTAALVGLFVIIGLAIAVTAIIWLGMSNYFDKGKTYVSYFDESVQGLDKDSPVKYRGVAIGRVESIGVAPDETLIQVVLSIEAPISISPDMVGQLKSVGITGIMFIELDRMPLNLQDRSPTLNFKPEYPVIKTKPSGIKMFLEGMDVVLEQIKVFDAEHVSFKLRQTMDSINKALADANIEAVSSDVRKMLAEIQTLLEKEKWNRLISSSEKTLDSYRALAVSAKQTVDQIQGNMNEISTQAQKSFIAFDHTISDSGKEFNAALGDFKNTMNNIDSFLNEGSVLMNTSGDKLSSLQRHLLVTLQNLEIASENLNDLLEQLSDQPSQIIFGEPVTTKKADLFEK